MSAGERSGVISAETSILQDELARLCLPSAFADSVRKIVWVNTLCACVLLAGIVGVRKPAAFVARLIQAEAMVVQPETERKERQPPEKSAIMEQEQRLEDSEETPPMVPEPAPIPVAPDPRGLEMPIPVPSSDSVQPTPIVQPLPPPRVIPKDPPPSGSKPSGLPAGGARKGWGTLSGSFPEMTGADYPSEAQKRRQEGTVRVQWTVQADGTVTDVEVKVSSGSPELDRAAKNWVKARYRFHPPGVVHRGVYWDFEFQLRKRN